MTMKARFLLASLALLTLAVMARPDLYVTRSYSGGRPTAILRFSETTGAYLGQNAYPTGFTAEAFLGVEVAPSKDVFALDNTLGYISAYRFAPDLTLRGRFGPSTPSLFLAYAGLTIDAQSNVLVASMLGSFGSVGIPGIFKLDAVTGQLTGPTPFASAPGMNQPYDLQFGPNGHLFVSDRLLGVLEFDASTGAYLRTLVPADPPRLFNVTGITFGPAGELFVASAGNSSVLRYNLNTATLDVFIAPGSGGLVSPADIDFGPDGDLYVADRGSHTVLRFRGSDGNPLGEFTPSGAGAFGTAGPEFLSFTPVAPKSFNIVSVTQRQGALTLTHDSDANFYYIAYRFTKISDTLRLPIDMALGQNGLGQLTDSAPSEPMGFYRVSRFPLYANIDSDGDGVSDAWELKNGLKPLQNDPSADLDGDGADNLTQYLQGRNPTKGVIADSGNIVKLQIFSPLENQTRR